MRSRAQSAFIPTLRELEGRMDLPIPTRLRILRELEADLHSLTTRYVAEGLSPVEARDRAREALIPEPGCLAELVRLHAPLYTRLTGSLASDRLGALERYALVVMTGLVLVAETVALLRVDLLRDPSPFLLPVLGLGALLLGLILGKTFELWVKRDHAAPGRGMRGILVLSGAVLLLGFGGTVVDLYGLAGELEEAPDLVGDLLVAGLLREAALLSVAILLALAGGLAWFGLSRWVALTSHARLTLLHLDSGTRNPAGRNDV